jgi:RHS repeat-associated protein
MVFVFYVVLAANAICSDPFLFGLLKATATYDDLNRPTGVAWDSSGVSGSAVGFVTGSRSVAYTWDSCSNGMGKLCSRPDHSGTASYAYDAWGRLTGQSFVPTGQISALSTGYGYDAYGRRASVVYPSGKALTFSYGSNGRISGMSWAGSAVIDGMTAQPMGGPVTGWNWSATGIPSTKAHVGLTYDLDGRLSHVTDVDDIDLIHDLDDKLTGTSYLTQTDKNQVYGYDTRHELTSADNALWGGAVSYTYDAAGNRTNKTWNTDQVQQGYGSSNNRLVSVTPVANGVPGTVQTRVFDAMGNTVDDGIGRTYGFDALGRMASASSSGSSTVFTVGTDGLRKRKVTTGLDATDKLYAYDDQRRLIGVYVPDGLGGFTVSEELVYLGSEWKIAGDVRGQVAGGSDGVFYPVLTDQIGSPRVVLDPSSGASRWEWEAKEAFGYQAPNENPGSVGVFKFDARLPDQWFDPETGLFQNGYRDYDPRTGRYVQSDPIGLGGGWNSYAYAGGQVTGAVDPLGLSRQDYTVTIPAIMRREVALMEREGRRRPGSGQENAWLNNVDYVIDGFNYFHKGNEYLVCIGQAERLLQTLVAVPAGHGKTLDNTWMFHEASDNMHHWIVGISTDRHDPVLRIDPWLNSVTPGVFDYDYGWSGVFHTSGSLSKEWIGDQQKAYSK